MFFRKSTEFGKRTSKLNKVNNLLDFLSSLGFDMIEKRKELNKISPYKLNEFIESLNKEYLGVIVSSNYLHKMNNISSDFRFEYKLQYFVTVSKEFLEKIDLTNLELNDKCEEYINSAIKLLYVVIKSEIFYTFKSEILELVKTNNKISNIISSFIEKEVEELFRSSFVSNMLALKKLEELINNKDYLDLEVLINLYMCTNPEEINHGMKEDLKRKETELLTRLDSITSELSRSIIIKNNQEELAHLAYKIRCLVREKRDKVSHIVLSSLLLLGSCYIVPKAATPLSTEYLINESIYTVDENGNEVLVNEQSYYDKILRGDKVTLRVYDKTENHIDYRVTKVYEDVKVLIEEELKSRNVIDSGEYKEVVFKDIDTGDTRIDESSKLNLCILGYILSLLFPGGGLIYNIAEYLKCKEGINYQKRRQEDSINLIEKTVDELLDRLSENKEIENKFYQILDSLDLPIDKENFISEIEALIERRKNIESKLNEEVYLAKVYRK